MDLLSQLVNCLLEVFHNLVFFDSQMSNRSWSSWESDSVNDVSDLVDLLEDFNNLVSQDHNLLRFNISNLQFLNVFSDDNNLLLEDGNLLVEFLDDNLLDWLNSVRFWIFNSINNSLDVVDNSSDLFDLVNENVNVFDNSRSLNHCNLMDLLFQDGDLVSNLGNLLLQDVDSVGESLDNLLEDSWKNTWRMDWLFWFFIVISSWWSWFDDSAIDVRTSSESASLFIAGLSDFITGLESISIFS